MPTLSIVNKESDLNSLIKTYKSGYVFNNNNQNPFKSLENELSKIDNYKYKSLSKNSFDMYKEMYETSNILDSLFNRIDNYFA